MDDGPEPEIYGAKTNAFKTLWDKIAIHRLPSYANRIFFSLGFLALTCLLLIIASGITLAFMGQTWWLTNPLGIYVRSVHLWTVQAFFFILVMHILVGVITSGFRAPRRMVWVFGACIFCLALIQTEFGYGLRGDFDSQYRAISGADFWNGAHVGYWLNPLSYSQSFALHVAIIPIAIILIFLAHYLLERTYGISLPYRNDIPVKMVAADHRILFVRGAVLVASILVLAFFFHSPYIPPVRIQDVAAQNQALAATTLVQEFERTSGTATYLDSIDPYTFDTRQVFVVVPYQQALAANPSPDAWIAFENENAGQQQADMREAEAYAAATDTSAFASSTNPIITMVRTLMPLVRSGLYESLIATENPNINNTYTLRFLNDMNALETKATAIGMDTAQWGMVKDDSGSALSLPPGSWWLAPLGLVNTLFNLLSNPKGDQIAGELLGFVILSFILFPYLPYVNRLPEALNLGSLVWGKPKPSGKVQNDKKSDAGEDGYAPRK